MVSSITTNAQVCKCRVLHGVTPTCGAEAWSATVAGLGPAGKGTSKCSRLTFGSTGIAARFRGSRREPLRVQTPPKPAPMKPHTPSASSQRLETPPTLCITIDEPMIRAAVTMPITSRFAARFTCSPKPCNAVVSTFSWRRPRRAACTSLRRSRGSSPAKSTRPSRLRRPRLSSAFGA
ncbi:hypothetical protein G6F22_018886 [Rhizopus arrhizus]|nr:hypothetical protein G6F22_018886 [Rhizopus arrhizus]